MYTKVLVLFTLQCVLGRPSQDDHHSVPYHGPLAKPVVLKSGYLADTHEVAAARSAHQAALEKESYNHGYSEGHEEYSHDDHHSVPYHGPLAKPVVLKSGYLADTHEVAAARSSHKAAVKKESYNHGYSEGDKEYSHNGYHSAPYHGPLAKPVVLKSGFLADTQDVAVAKQHHLQALHSDGHVSYYNGHY